MERIEHDAGGCGVSEQIWKWWAVRRGKTKSGRDDIYSGPFDSRASAVAEGSKSLGLPFEIFETQFELVRLSEWVDVDKLVDNAECKISKDKKSSAFFAEWFYFDSPPEHDNDLRERIKRVCDEWQVAHGIVFSVPTFSTVRNNEAIPAAVTSEAAK